jgi:hypothetical protein
MIYYFCFLLTMLVGFSVYAGYRMQNRRLEDIVQSTLETLEREKIIRIMEQPDGEYEVYSGTKYYKI